ncbi:hypothetical protein VXE32_007496 [Burkholderia cepacia]|nr:hypothetical protein [Burkholderia cepacia]
MQKGSSHCAVHGAKPSRPGTSIRNPCIRPGSAFTVPAILGRRAAAGLAGAADPPARRRHVVACPAERARVPALAVAAVPVIRLPLAASTRIDGVVPDEIAAAYISNSLIDLMSRRIEVLRQTQVNELP